MAYVVKNDSTFMGSAIVGGVGRRINPSESVTFSEKPTSTSPNVRVFQIDDIPEVINKSSTKTKED